MDIIVIIYTKMFTYFRSSNLKKIGISFQIKNFNNPSLVVSVFNIECIFNFQLSQFYCKFEHV